MAEKRVKLMSSEGEIFEVDEAVAFESQFVKNMIEHTGMDAPIPLPTVSTKVLAKVIEYCKNQVENQKTPDDKAADDIKTWDDEFLKVDQATLCELMKAAKYLDIKNLLDLTCQSVAHLIKFKSPQEIRKIFAIRTDYTHEEEEFRKMK